jgi:hypothetical protein
MVDDWAEARSTRFQPSRVPTPRRHREWPEASLHPSLGTRRPGFDGVGGGCQPMVSGSRPVSQSIALSRDRRSQKLLRARHSPVRRWVGLPPGALKQPRGHLQASCPLASAASHYSSDQGTKPGERLDPPKLQAPGSCRPVLIPAGGSIGLAAGHHVSRHRNIPNPQLGILVPLQGHLGPVR